MKQFRRFLWALLLIGMAIAIYSSAVGETAPEKINWGGAEPAAGSWARTADAMPFIRLPVSGTARSICSGCRRGRS